jgi:hypothetical protein
MLQYIKNPIEDQAPGNNNNQEPLVPKVPKETAKLKPVKKRDHQYHPL